MGDNLLGRISFELSPQGTLKFNGAKYQISCSCSYCFHFHSEEGGKWKSWRTFAEQTMRDIVSKDSFPKRFYVDFIVDDKETFSMQYLDNSNLDFIAEKDIPDDCRATI